MGRIGLAFRVFFRVLFDAALAERLRPLLIEPPPVSPPPAAPPQAAPKPKKAAARGEALNLLAMLQREARLVDFIQEPIAAYTDEQIGAAARDVHRDCAAVFERVFALTPIREEAEGATIELSGELDAGRYRLSGAAPEHPPYRGALVHHGWQATRCVLPEWTGTDQAALVIAPAVLELT